MKKRTILFSFSLVFMCTFGCFLTPSNDSERKKPSLTPLPSFRNAEIGFVSEMDETIAYCRKLILEDNGDWEKLTDEMMDSLAKEDAGTAYIIEFGTVESRQSNLLRGPGDEPITTNERIGKEFYSYLEKNGQIPFSFVEYYSDASKPMIAYWKMIPKEGTCFYLVRGNPVDALQIERVSLQVYYQLDKAYERSVYIEPINDSWYIFYTQPSVDESLEGSD